MKKRAGVHRQLRRLLADALSGRFWAVSSLAVIITGALMVAAPAALADGGDYCGAAAGYVPGYTNCYQVESDYVTGNSYNQALTYHQNDGDYVCQTIENSRGGWVSRNCGQNEAVSGTVSTDPYDVQYFLVGNDSPNQHYVDGYWAANF